MPSFSSKGFPEVCKIIEYSAELIDGPALVSAYDLHYEKGFPGIEFASIIFLDSGGYEASKDKDLSDTNDVLHAPRAWTQEMHENQITKWKPAVYSVIISYDHPDERLPVEEQIERASGMATSRSDVIREMLIKPEKKGQTQLQITKILENIRRFENFDIIGVTEKEVGNSIFDRMKNIAKIRQALKKIGLDTPIHVFGSLDTVTTPLYFLAGADIFDGLTWLRYAYHEGQTIYKHNFGALQFGTTIKAHVVDGRCWNSNYYYIKEMEQEMRRYLRENDISVFSHHSNLFEKALGNVKEAIGE